MEVGKRVLDEESEKGDCVEDENFRNARKWEFFVDRKSGKLHVMDVNFERRAVVSYVDVDSTPSSHRNTNFIFPTSQFTAVATFWYWMSKIETLRIRRISRGWGRKSNFRRRSQRQRLHAGEQSWNMEIFWDSLTQRTQRKMRFWEKFRDISCDSDQSRKNLENFCWQIVKFCVSYESKSFLSTFRVVYRKLASLSYF